MTTHFSSAPVGAIPLEALRHGSDVLRPLALIVDDEPVITDTLAAILDSHGIATMTAYNGLDALEIAMLIPPEILITDLSMPGLNGLDLALRVAQAVPDCEIVISSGHASGVDLMARMHTIKCNFVTLLKPVHPADLLDHVFELLARHGRCAGAPRGTDQPTLRISSPRRAPSAIPAPVL